ncbi:MAG TPA: saccharopine dehydrogenase NADP-binding domain-containing protein [Actinomycetota bacterium]|nr:saccharopine dehydrogenase NADP-binding domain-containing protein [Actinomycetota bacterium]
MPDVLLFGATGYTGTLTAAALQRRGASFVVAGRDRRKLDALAERTGAAGVRVAAVGDVDALSSALSDVSAMITCVGPFMDLGQTAVEAAIRAGVHYVDSSGEIDFIDVLADRYDAPAKNAGIVLAPAMGYDEVPADVGLSRAVEGVSRPIHVALTHAFPSKASTGTLRTVLGGIAGADACWVAGGRLERVPIASRRRWAPMPAPLGPKLGIPMPLAIGRLAPVHLELDTFEVYGTSHPVQAAAMRAGMPVAKRVLALDITQRAIDAVLDRRAPGPSPTSRQQDRFTILVEAWSASEWRNVTLQGVDAYGITAETLAAGALKLAREGHDSAGVMAPTQAIGCDLLENVLINAGVDIAVYEPVDAA